MQSCNIKLRFDIKLYNMYAIETDLKSAGPQWSMDYSKRKLNCHGDVYTLSQSFVWITILLFNQLAEFWVAYFRVVYFPAKVLWSLAKSQVIDGHKPLVDVI